MTGKVTCLTCFKSPLYAHFANGLVVVLFIKKVLFPFILNDPNNTIPFLQRTTQKLHPSFGIDLVPDTRCLFIIINITILFITFKGLVHPKMKIILINYSLSCHSKPIKPLIISRTQINIFLMKSKSFLTLKRQQRNYHVQGPER